MEDKHDRLIDEKVFNMKKEIHPSEHEGMSAEKLQEHVEFRKQLVREFESKEVQDLSKRLDKIHASVVLEESSPKSNWITYLLGAIALLALAFLLNSTLSKPKVSETRLYAENFHPEKINTVSRENNNEELLALQTAFNDEDYTQALTRLNAIIAEDSDPEWKIYRGISLLKLNKEAEANKDFIQVSESKSILWRDHADWYLGLSYLKTANKEKAKEILMRFANDSEADFHLQAKGIISQL